MKNYGIILSGIILMASSAGAADLAKVNGRAITEKDLKSALTSMNEGMRENMLKDSNTRRQILESVIDKEVLVQEGDKEKLDQSPEYKEALSEFRKQFLVSKLLQKNIGNKLTETAAKNYFESNKRRFSTDQVHAMHILLADEKQAADLFKKAKATKTDDEFQELAEKNSKDPSAKNNRGDLGFFGRDRMVAEFTDAAFAGVNGEILGPIKTAFGYHIIKVVEKKIGKLMEYSEVELKVKNDLKQDLIQTYVSKLKKQSKITVDEKAVEKL
ncbi:MAG: peptidylprolyl isomerase [Bdellovibrionota bacterium]